MRHKSAVLALLQFCCAAGASAQEAGSLAEVLSAPITVERSQGQTTITLQRHMGKLVLEAQADGERADFIFDTGSPSMISRELAERLGLRIVGALTGRDANGTEVTTQIALIDRLTLGDTTFLSVPVSVFDFSSIDPEGCFFDGGVIGSEIFAGSVWHIDPSAMALEIAADADALAHLPEGAPRIESTLHDFGYPHAPIFDYAIGELEDKALFDTGSGEVLALYERVAQGREVAGLIAADTVRSGRGSEGVSAGGPGADRDLARFAMQGLALGDGQFETLAATTRGAPPTLIGMGILATHHVVLDYPGGSISFIARDDPQTRPAHPGFAITQRAGKARVTQLFDGSPGALNGLRLGDEVIAIDGRHLSDMGGECAIQRWLIEDRAVAEARSLIVSRDGEQVSIEIGQ